MQVVEEEMKPSVVGVMLRQEELAFTKAMSTAEHSPFFLRELRKAMTSGKKNLAATNANVLSVSAQPVARPKRPMSLIRSLRAKEKLMSSPACVD